MRITFFVAVICRAMKENKRRFVQRSTHEKYHCSQWSRSYQTDCSWGAQDYIMVSQVDGIHLQLSSVDSHDLGSNWPWLRPRWLLHNVTGPPGTLLFDRDQRSHWNNHYNCSFVRITAVGIYCTDFLSQIVSQVKYPMQFMVHENMYQHSVVRY